MAIDSLEAMHAHLQWAVELEHSTIPPYLCALYSIREDANEEAAEVVRSDVLTSLYGYPVRVLEVDGSVVVLAGGRVVG